MALFRLLPPEVWEMSLDKLVDSQDVLNAFRAYPELEAEGILRTKRHLWLLDQIIPHVATWLNRKELLLCREVCQQWCHGVDNFLENHPRHRAFDHERRITGQIWIPQASPRFREYALLFDPRLIDIFGDKIGEFYKKICEHPRERSPFVGRTLLIHAGSRVLHPLQTRVAMWNEALDFVRQIGDKIWYLDLEPHYLPDTSSFCRLVLAFVENTPNLKSLSLGAHFVDDFAEEEANKADEEMAEKYLDSLKAAFPPLPHLDTLSITDEDEDTLVPLVLARFLIECYSKEIKRLELPFYLWEHEFGSVLRNLTQLTVTDYKYTDVFTNAEALDVLRSLNSPNLWELRIDDYAWEVLSISFNDFLKALAPFTRLHSLTLTCPSDLGNSFTFKRGATLLTGPTSTSIPSLKSLFLFCVSEDGDNFAFINIIHFVKLHFPSLEHLKVTCRMNGNDKDPHPTREEVYEFNVWEAWLPKLKSIMINICFSRVRYYTRENYERHNDFDLPFLFGNQA